MRRNVPYSPFTTRLSGSAKETELRLRSIFQWKKKRPPVILFILVAVILLAACGNLVGFGTTGKEDEPESVPYTAVIGEKSLVEITENLGLVLSLDAEAYPDKDTKITYKLENNSDSLYEFGPGEIFIETWHDGAWHTLEYCTDIGDIVVKSIAYYVNPDETFEGKESFFEYGDIVPTGKYRLVIGVSKKITIPPEHYIAAEFLVVPASTIDEPQEATPHVPTAEELYPEFFLSYVSEFPGYTYTGWKMCELDGHVFTMEDTPKNLAEAAVIEWHRLSWTGETKKLDLCCGNEALLFGAASNYKTYTIHELSTLPPDDFSMENMPYLDAFLRWLTEDIQEFGLTEYTVVYAGLSWEWTAETLALGPQLGNGRYEQLYLVGRTEPDGAWKLYEVYWGEQVYGRILNGDAILSTASYFPQRVEPGASVLVDLNGDKTPERICVSLNNDTYTLTVNGVDHSADFERLGIWFQTPETASYAITDLDPGDGLLELALSDDGPSNNPHTCFLRWDGTQLLSLGEVYGMESRNELTYLGGGVVSSYFRLSVLQTWYAPVQWRVNSDGQFGIVPQELYDPIPSSPPQTITALKELAVYADRDSASERTALTAGTSFTLTATDNARWVQCEGETGDTFWLHLDEETGHSVELFDGAYSWAALDGLNMAD